MIVVPRRPVALEPKAAARALVAALKARAGAAPPRELARVLLAMIWFETAGRPNNFNAGNLMAASLVGGREVATWPGEAWRPGFYELTVSSSAAEIASHAAMMAGKEPTAFRAYPDAEAGFADFVGLLAHKFGGMLSAAAAGDVAAFSSAYVSSGYCPRCTPENVRRNIESRLAYLDGAGAFDGLELAPPPGPGPAGPAVLLAAAAVAAVLLWLTQRKAAA